ncbi:hypothetical protein P4O66_001756 [Electrophorus voltai]|uniref:Uncharacterized protein n=1 Tax=Electrophorus voltai TaxID=2609070 RepID=A0AAD8Z3Z1_9TELE|nr:hypothetical protein P4O66_001756 [Electrophorus voltai]
MYIWLHLARYSTEGLLQLGPLGSTTFLPDTKCLVDNGRSRNPSLKKCDSVSRPSQRLWDFTQHLASLDGKKLTREGLQTESRMDGMLGVVRELQGSSDKGDPVNKEQVCPVALWANTPHESLSGIHRYVSSVLPVKMNPVVTFPTGNDQLLNVGSRQRASLSAETQLPAELEIKVSLTEVPGRDFLGGMFGGGGQGEGMKSITETSAAVCLLVLGVPPAHTCLNTVTRETLLSGQVLAGLHTGSDPQEVIHPGDLTADSSPCFNNVYFHASDTSPSLWDTSPSLWDTSPSLQDSSPSLRDTSPSLWDTSPSLWDTSPSLQDTSLRDTSQSLWDTSSSLRETSKSLRDTSPNLRDTSPSMRVCEGLAQ